MRSLMNPQYLQLRACYEKYGFAEVVPYGSGFAIHIIKSHQGKKPVYGHVSYTSGSVFIWDTEQASLSFLADTLDGL